MESNQNDYHISFFKPKTEHARSNRNMVIWLVCIWTVAIFGFQIMLRVLEKPKPEEAYLTFQNVWENVRDNKASEKDLQQFAQVSLSVLGKNFIKPEYRSALDNALSWSVYELTADEEKSKVFQFVEDFNKTSAEVTDITDPEFVELKNRIAGHFSTLIGLSANDVRSTIIPIEIQASAMKEFPEATREIIPGCMSLYLIHNQSFLTEARFLGFPFHYFYSAIFLLVLFVGLCWLYCKFNDRINAKHGLE